MRLILDAGALIGIDRQDKRVAALIELGRRAGAELVSSAPVVGQAWRNGARQANLARALAMIDFKPVMVEDAKRAGELLADSGSTDIVDALIAMLAMPHDQILTSDAGDMQNLLTTRSVSATIVRV